MQNFHDVSMLNDIGQHCLIFSVLLSLISHLFFAMYFRMFLALLFLHFTLLDVKVQVVVVMYFEPLGVFLSLPSSCVYCFGIFNSSDVFLWVVIFHLYIIRFFSASKSIIGYSYAS